MPRRAKEMRPLQIRKLAKPGCHAVGGVAGLCLQVTPAGAKSWVLRIVMGARRREFGLGGYPTVSLEQARDKARDMRAQIDAGADPAAERREKREALRAATAHRVTFNEAAKQYLAIKLPELKTNRQREDWRRSLGGLAIGSVPVADITMHDVLAILQSDWLGKTPTMSKLRQRIEAVLSWSIVHGHRPDPNPARWAGNLEIALSKPGKIAKTTHQAAMLAADLPAFYKRLRAQGGMAAKALQLVILTGLRSSEVRLAQWSEFDFDAGTWTIPAERMKAGLAHVVPITGAMHQLLDSLPRQPNGFVFEKANGKPLADSALYNLLKIRLQQSCTVHGFRSSVKDWARTEHPEVPDEVSELQLAHVSNDATRAAYARDKLLKQRAELMEAWAEHCNGGAQKAREAA